MTTTLIICGTVVLCLMIIPKWVTDMSRAELPMFTYGECVWSDKVEESTQNETNPVGFAPPEESTEKKSDKEVKDLIMKDPITMTAALLRGEVDIDELTN
jgi:hypothetical protein